MPGFAGSRGPQRGGDSGVATADATRSMTPLSGLGVGEVGHGQAGQNAVE
jgi:hypothetical protein